jgi:hypothetical protein
LLNIIFIIIIIIIIIAFLYCIYIISKLAGIKRLQYARNFSQTGLFEGEKVNLHELIYNHFFIPLLFIDVYAYIYSSLSLTGVHSNLNSKMQLFVSRFSLLPFLQVKRTHEITCLKRGFYKLETIEISAFKSTRYINAETLIYVYPKLTSIDQVPFNSTTLQGDYFSNRWLIQDPFSLSGIREYQNGDPFNCINFKATAKNNKLKVNMHEYSTNKSLLVYLNLQTKSEALGFTTDDARIEKGLSYAATIIKYSIENGIKTGFSANCTLTNGEQFIHFPASGGKLQLEAILQEMAKAYIKIGISFNALLNMDLDVNISNTDIQIISTYISPSIDNQLELFKRLGNNVNIILI